MVGASGKDASWSPPYEGVPGTSSWKEVQVHVERVAPWNPPKSANKKEVWEAPAKTAASTTGPRISG